MCNWEDDGQDDADADVVRGGPNGALSLTQARANYLAFGPPGGRRREPTTYERRRAERGRSGANPYATHNNVGLAMGGAMLLGLALLNQDARGSPVCIGALGLPLFLAQLAFGLVPALSDEHLSRGARLRSIALALGGSLATVAAFVVSSLTGSMC